MGQGMDLYGGQPPSMNLGMGSTTPFPTDMGPGLKPPSSFGQMPAGGMDMQSTLGAMQALGGLMGGQQQPQMQEFKLPSGGGQSYEDLMKMYGVRSGGLLG
jgi:hypothetical protein